MKLKTIDQHTTANPLPVTIRGTPFSVTVSGGRAGAGMSDGSFSVPAGKVLEIRDITGYIRPDAAGSDIVIGPFVATNLAGTGYLHTLVPQRVGIGEGLGPRYNIHENATWFAEGNVNVEMRTSGAITWLFTFTGSLQ
jgi:hypothetical protein